MDFEGRGKLMYRLNTNSTPEYSRDKEKSRVVHFYTLPIKCGNDNLKQSSLI